MAECKAVVEWRREPGAAFTDNRYSRAHRWSFDGGIEVPASSSPAVVKPPLSLAEAVDPEEALVAALSSCHMLWFLSLAAKRGYVIDGYRDEASGVLGKNAAGKMAMTVVTLRPRIAFSGDRQPTGDELDSLHHDAHEQCFIANSVNSEIRIEPVFT
jgi:organic hydroperoxide reductase OsmC/OhrA